MTTPQTVERQTVAFMQDPDAERPSNPIHSTGGAREYGYQGALIGGVVVYGWTVPAIVEALGERWLWDGWAEVAFRRPVYPGQQLTTRVSPVQGSAHELIVTNDEGANAIAGRVGLGDAPWLDSFQLPTNRAPQEPPAEIPTLTLEAAPVGRDLRAMAVPVSAADARSWSVEREGDDNPLFTSGERPLLHPGWIAGRMTPLVHHSYHYAPAIHAKSQMQHRARAEAGQTLTVAGRMVAAYERKGHHYYEADGVIAAEDGTELALIRHTSIFCVAKRG